MDFLKKLQDQPKQTRKAIFWVAVIVIGIIFLFAWIQIIKTRIKSFRQEEFLEQLRPPPKYEEELKNLPKIEMPQFPELTEEEKEDLKKLEEELMKEQPEFSE